jgi:hypothetical protein
LRVRGEQRVPLGRAAVARTDPAPRRVAQPIAQTRTLVETQESGDERVLVVDDRAVVVIPRFPLVLKTNFPFKKYEIKIPIV